MATFRRKWGSFSSGGENGTFNTPTGITAHSDEIYVADQNNRRIQVFHYSDGSFQRKWGSSGTADGEFNYPTGITIYNDEVYVVDSWNHRVQVFNTNGVFQRKWGSYGTSDGKFNYPNHIVVYKDRVYVGSGSLRIQVFDTDGNYIRKWSVDSLYAIAAYKDEIYISDGVNDRIQVYNTNGVLQRQWGSSGIGDGKFDVPHGITMDNDEVYVADGTYLNQFNRIQVFETDGTFKRKWGNTGTGDGEFRSPGAITFYADELYVVDAVNHRVQVFLPLSLVVCPVIPIPDYPLKESKYYDTLITDIPGKELSRSRHTTPLRSWTLNYSAIHDGDCKYLWDFFAARKGKLERFYFIHPETGTIYKARFADDSLKRDEIGNNLFNVTINLIEVTS